MADVFRWMATANGAAGGHQRLGVQLTPAYQRFDAEAHFRLAPQRVCDDPRARCGEC